MSQWHSGILVSLSLVHIFMWPAVLMFCPRSLWLFLFGYFRGHTGEWDSLLSGGGSGRTGMSPANGRSVWKKSHSALGHSSILLLPQQLLSINLSKFIFACHMCIGKHSSKSKKITIFSVLNWHLTYNIFNSHSNASGSHHIAYFSNKETEGPRDWIMAQGRHSRAFAELTFNFKLWLFLLCETAPFLILDFVFTP